MKRILMTGATGHMGKAVFEQIFELGKFDITLLLRPSKKNITYIRKFEKNAKKKGIDLRLVFGDISDFYVCKSAVKGADYILHLAAIIPPKSDYSVDTTYHTNFVGTKNLVDAVIKAGMKDSVKFIHIATVAEYGNRNYKHPWGRVGDPLMCSYFDIYGVTKTQAERYVIDSGLAHWVSLRQTGILYDEILDNRTDGLLFHTVWNCPIEWTTAKTSGIMLKNLVEKDLSGDLPEKFWKKCYNIGNGATSRVTGYETVDGGFKMMGCSAKDIYEPQNSITRNFHCMWFYDSDELNDYLDFRYENVAEFYKQLGKKLWYFKLGKPFKKLIKKFVIQKCYKSPNAPKFWIDNNLEKRVNAFYGGIDEYNALPKDWKDFHLLCEGKLPDGTDIDYEDLKDITKVKEKGLLLNHGYDETKPDEDLDIEDMQSAAAFRGGKCLSDKMAKGDLYTKLKWQDYDGNVFEASPYCVLKAGHWGGENGKFSPWKWDEIAKHSPFIAQIWYDTHSEKENMEVNADECRDLEEFSKKRR